MRLSNGIAARLAILAGIVFCASAAIQAKDGFGGESFWLLILGAVSIVAGLALAGHK